MELAKEDMGQPIFTYTPDDAVADGCVLDLAVKTERIKPIHEIDSMDEYLRNYGKILGKKAIEALTPLHVPSLHLVPDFDYVPANRKPFPAQEHVIAAAVKMFNRVGSGFICGEMGTGKTILGILSAHEHASLSRKQGGLGGKYRSLVLCPDHLIGKWAREIEETIPGAVVTRFGPKGAAVDPMKPTKKRRKKGEDAPDPKSKAILRDVVALLGNRDNKSRDVRWTKPNGAEWFVLGRNQAKWLSDWVGIADPAAGFRGVQGALCEIATTAIVGRDRDGQPITHTNRYTPMPIRVVPSENAVSSKFVAIDRIHVTDDKGYTKYDGAGRPIMRNIMGRVHQCPKCGTVIRDKRGTPRSAKDLSCGKKVTQKVCSGTYLKMLPAEADKKSHATFSIPIPGKIASMAEKIGHEVNHGGFKWVVTACNERLFNYTRSPYRWSPARIIQKKCKRFFNYLVIDEVHEQKSDESGQSMACGKLISSVSHVLALTGTIIGGYANHLYPLLMRITPKTLRDEGFEWGKDLEFSKRYGRIDTIVTIKEEDDSGPSVRGNSKSMRRAKSGSRTSRVAVRPGVMPTMFGRHMIGASIFIALDEMVNELPDLFEYVGGTVGPPPKAEDFDDPEIFEAAEDRHAKIEEGWFDTAVEMEPDQAAEYKRVMSILEFTNKELLRKGSMKLLGTFLWTGLDYPDKPFGWVHDPEVLKAAAAVESQAPALLGQSFLKAFNHEYDRQTQSLVLTRGDGDQAETDRIPLIKDGGIYWLDVTFNSNVTKRLAYDTGASTISLPAAMAYEIGLSPKESVTMRIADGSTVEDKSATAGSVKVGKFTVKDVECTIDMPKLPHTVGFWNKPGSRKIEDFVGVVTPQDCPEDRIYPKERKLIDICLKQKKEGRQTWVYVNMTGTRDILPRLKKMLEASGLKVGVLRSKDVEPIEREEWIERNGRDYDVMLSFPQLVSTGLDLFSKKPGGHNYATLVFYETGYNLFTMRQAARRAWRIGQPHDCRVYYLYYKETMQHKAMSLMSRKMSASQALEGEFSEEGLAAMAGEDNLQMALAKNLSERIDDSDMQRTWTKTTGKPKKIVCPTAAVAGMEAGHKHGPLDDLPIELQIVAETMLDNQGKPVPADALAEFPRLAAELAALDTGFDALETNEEFANHNADTGGEADDEEEDLVVIPMEFEEEEEESEFDTTFDEEYEPEGTRNIPELTPEILAKMFANMISHGLSVG